MSAAPSIPVIAVDGPAASGKGTIAAAVAHALAFHYLDSGSLYRLVALQALRTGTGFDEEEALANFATACPSVLRRWPFTARSAPPSSAVSGPSAGLRGSWPMGGTWGRSCSRMPRSRSSSRPPPRNGRGGGISS